MKMSEYLEVQRLTYREYCAYLQRKYGIGRSDYMTASWNPRKACKRTDVGLFIHHVFEDHTIMLSHRDWAMTKPREWQAAENLVYCDYLEHLFLHILICEYPVSHTEDVGVGGVINHLVPQLNDLYSGWQPKMDYIKICFELVGSDKSVYLELLRRFMNTAYYAVLGDKCLLTSSAAKYGRWSAADNRALFMEVKRL